MTENELMNDRLDQLDGSLDDTNTVVAKKYFQAQLQLEQLQEENFRYGLVTSSSTLNSEEFMRWIVEKQYFKAAINTCYCAFCVQMPTENMPEL